MPHNEWILDVLSDLKTFAAANGMSALAEQLDDTKLIAAAEIAFKNEKARAPANGNEGRFEPGPRGTGWHQLA
ncbi:hypothetical protein FGK63_03810 [Ruegeria sediminis]|uniref:Uncharacterized protein n=1 Tax=Ruegeria sediminis TaxID=2583820 RepID=A0ABY2X578_9RHOB|nr:hypothetical protein [Ruegeria sediminis]TMV10199.1 hypothetical protein FGK63_03810 [Ruegeria sediminis]